MAKRALIVIDLQNDYFPGGKWPLDGVETAAANAARLIAAARAAADFGYKVTVIHDACASRDLAFGGVTVPAAHAHAAFMSALGFAYAALLSTDDYLGTAAVAA